MFIPSKAKTVAAATLAAGIMMALVGCSGVQTGKTPKETATDTVTVNNVEPAAGLVPANTDDLAGWKVVTQLFEGLVTFDEHGTVVNANAKSITPNTNASQYTIKLKPDLTFSDGEKITATTYAKSWSFAANAANKMMGGSIFSTIKGYDTLQDPNGDKNTQLPGLKVVDENTLLVTLAAPDSSFGYKVGDVAFLPLPNSAYRNIRAFGEHPVGNGPYSLVSWTHDQQIRLKPNPKYQGPRKPQNQGLTFTLYTSLDTAYSDLEGGNLDVLDTIPNAALTTFRSEKNIKAYNTAGPAFKSFTIPETLKHFTGEEGRLRREAICLAIDRKDITDKVLHGTGTPATDFTAPTITGHTNDLPGVDILKYDQEKSRELWRQADAIAPFDGTFRLSYSTDSGFKPWVDAIINSLNNTLHINAQAFPMPTQKEFRGAIQNRTIDAAFVQGLQSDYPHPEGYLVQAYASVAADGKGLNNGDYKNPQYDALLAQAAAQPTLKDSIGTYHEAQSLLLHDLPAIPLWYANVTAASGPNIHDVRFSYMGVPEYERLNH
jgi:oligopeptide transport system substrate-binding protein